MLPPIPAGSVALPVVVGLAFGTLLQKSRFCFVSALRDFVARKETRVLHGLLAGVVVMTAFWSLQATLGLSAGFWTPDWGVTSFVGGLVFGVGMTVAGGCAAGTLYRACRGDLQFVLTLVFVLVGHVLFAAAYPFLRTVYFGPLRVGEGVSVYDLLPWPPILTGLLAAGLVVLGYAFLAGRGSSRRRGTGAFEWRGTPDRGVDAAVVRGVVDLARAVRRHATAVVTDERSLTARLRSPWDARTSGVAMALVASVWFAAHGAWGIAGSESRWVAWAFDRVGGDAARVTYWGSVLFDGAVAVTPDMVLFIAMLVGMVGAAVLSGQFALRWPAEAGLFAPVVGGLLMGVGSRLGPGATIANLFSGLALLSAHSLLASAGVVVGVYVTTHWLRRGMGCAV
ncbi:YeeE/YedE family protein [Halolamina litorea]|uniref:YeeE/YedE thiosulfate transporter family protein n=1 Tax=Halolamina litorea TaxID=1515593 RepID=A0ABD6BS60_9EURY|nr:YeeE/YedE thiosulfate transporter family protein [Halolamina litorea]